MWMPQQLAEEHEEVVQEGSTPVSEYVKVCDVPVVLIELMLPPTRKLPVYPKYGTKLSA